MAVHNLWHLLDDLTYLRFKAHVQHAIGLIKDEELAAGQHNDRALDKVVQTAGRGDDDIRTESEALCLGALIRAAIDADGAQSGAVCQLLGLQLNL